MRWPMSSQFWWEIVGDNFNLQHQVYSCSDLKQYLDTWTAPSLRWHTIFSHFKFSPRYHIMSSTSWYNLYTSFHEYGSVGHQLLYKWNHNGIPTSEKSAPSPPLYQNYLASTPFFINATEKHPNFLNSTIKHRIQNLEYSTNAPSDPQNFLFSLNNKPKVDKPLSLYSGLIDSFGWYSPSTNYISNKISKTRNR